MLEAVGINISQPNMFLGKDAESYAEKFLRAKGLQLISKNYRCRWGEIDLIMKEKETLVFVEVRMRNNRFYGGAIGSVDYFKQIKLERTASHYIKTFYNDADIPDCRCDLIVIQNGKLSWIRDINIL